MQGGRPPQPSGTNRPSSSACPSHGRSRGVLLARAVRPPGPGGHDPEAERPQTASGHGRGGTPGPIPNPEVKPPSADCTAGPARGRPGRRWPTGGVFARRGPAPSAGPFFRGPVEPGPGTCAVQGPFHNLGGGRVLRSADQAGTSCPATFTWGRPAADTCRARGALSRLRHKLARFLRRASTTRDPIGPSQSCAYSWRGDGNPESAQRQGVCSWISPTYVATVTLRHESSGHLA